MMNTKTYYVNLIDGDSVTTFYATEKDLEKYDNVQIDGDNAIITVVKKKKKKS